MLEVIFGISDHNSLNNRKSSKNSYKNIIPSRTKGLMITFSINACKIFLFTKKIFQDRVQKVQK